MKSILVRAALIALVLVQVLSIMLLIDQKKTAKAQCVPIPSVACNVPFSVAAKDSGGNCGYTQFACTAGVVSAATWTMGAGPCP